jgi:uncharacterized membrane protein YfcA
MTPLLVLLFRHPSQHGRRPDLLYAAATGSRLAPLSMVEADRAMDIVGRLAMGSVPTTAATLWVLAQQGKQTATVNTLITMALGWALIVTAVAILFRKAIVGYFLARTKQLEPGQAAGLTVLLGAVLGVLVALTSVGAGALGMTVLLILYPKMDVAKLVGSDIAHAVPLTLIAGLGHWMMGSVNWQLLVSLLIGSIPGIILGSLLAARTPDGVLRPVLAGTLALVGGKLLT